MSNPHVVTTVKCAGPGCSHVRQLCNHWYIVFEQELVGDGEMVRRFCCEPLKLDDIEELPKDCEPVCGQSCAVKLFEAWMAKAGAQ